jgi:hypothetical protein
MWRRGSSLPHRRCAIVAPEPAKIEAVSKVSIAQKLGVVARVAAQQARRSRTLTVLTKAAKAAALSFGRVAHGLWLEVTGLVFLAMAGMGGVALVREYLKYEAGHATASRMVVAICFTLTFAWFGVSSFWKVRKSGSKQRS